MLKRQSLWLLAIILPYYAVPSLAFNPTWLYTGYGVAGTPHEAMTKSGVTSRLMEYFGIDATAVSNSMDLARKEMMAGPAVVDDHADTVYKEAENPDAHCDDEHLEECNTRLINAKADIKTQLESGDVSEARTTVGRMLHTLQDFYSHSNASTSRAVQYPFGLVLRSISALMTLCG